MKEWLVRSVMACLGYLSILGSPGAGDILFVWLWIVNLAFIGGSVIFWLTYYYQPTSKRKLQEALKSFFDTVGQRLWFLVVSLFLFGVGWHVTMVTYVISSMSLLILKEKVYAHKPYDGPYSSRV